MSATRPATKYVFVTGGVVSALGKGIVAASLGRLLKARGLRVQAQKFDPYLNVDPGTMSPFQHGEVFVTEDGAETDLDIGHYERFIDENLSRNASHTRRRDLGRRAAQGAQGRVPRRDRPGDPAHHERDQGADPARREGVDPPTSSSPRSAAPSATSSRCRSSRRSASSGARSGRRTCSTSTCTLVPFIEAAGELKTKPTQHSVNELRRIGIHPDVDRLPLARGARRRTSATRSRSSPTSTSDAVIASPDVADVYLVPRRCSEEGLDTLVCEQARARRRRRPSSASGSELIDADRRAARRGRDRARRQVREAARRLPLGARGAQARRRPPRRARARALGRRRGHVATRRRPSELEQVDGVLVPGGFGSRGWEGKILACRVARERGIPYLGICLGHARRRLRVRAARRRARRRELDRDGPGDAVPGDRPAARAEGDRGPRRDDAPRRAGGRARRRARGRASLRRGGRPRAPPAPLRGEQPVPPTSSIDAGLVVSGTFQEGRLVEIVELPDHPWFVASQFHPEFKSRPTRPAPLFREFVGAGARSARAARAASAS